MDSPGPTREAGWNNERIARAWAELMARLGYQRYGAVGNDAGSMISPELGRIDPDHVVGVHVTQVFSFPSGDPAEMKDLDTRGAVAAADAPVVLREQVQLQHAPVAAAADVGYAIDDSPVGLLAWQAQLLGEDLDEDFALTNVMTYWLTRTGSSAGRLYYENARAPRPPRRRRCRSDSPGSAGTFLDFAGSRNGTTRTSFTGRRMTTVATSRPTRFPSCTSPMCGLSFARSVTCRTDAAGVADWSRSDERSLCNRAARPRGRTLCLSGVRHWPSAWLA